MKGYLDAKELESYKKEDLQELAKQLGVDAEGTKKEIAARCAAVEVDIPDNSELTEEDKKVAAEAAAEAAAKAEEEKKAVGLVKVKAQRRFLDKELNQITCSAPFICSLSSVYAPVLCFCLSLMPSNAKILARATVY